MIFQPETYRTDLKRHFVTFSRPLCSRRIHGTQTQFGPESVLGRFLPCLRRQGPLAEKIESIKEQDEWLALSGSSNNHYYAPAPATSHRLLGMYAIDVRSISTLQLNVGTATLFVSYAEHTTQIRLDESEPNHVSNNIP